MKMTEWKNYVIRQLSKDVGETEITVKGQILSESWNRVTCSPYLVYLPEKDRIMMELSFDYDEMMYQPGMIDKSLLHHPMVLCSDDEGATWSDPMYVHTGDDGKPDCGLGTALTYIGDGKVMLYTHEPHVRWFSDDYGKTWGNTVPIDPAPDGESWELWDPALVDTDPQTGKVVRIMETGYTSSSEPEHFQAYVRFSNDEGQTWSEPITVPEWEDMNEVCLVRAANGDIVAMCRTDVFSEYKHTDFDHYCGLGVSISKDNGYTWSKVKILYDWGRHHPCAVLMLNGDIVVSYVVRLGYPDTDDGYPQFGVEAIISRDNGETWDMDNRYILDSWVGKTKAARCPDDIIKSGSWHCAPQTTSSILLPSGSILTAYGTNYRAQEEGWEPFYGPRDTGLVKWTPK
jgi:hypothetical protein